MALLNNLQSNENTDSDCQYETLTDNIVHGYDTQDNTEKYVGSAAPPE